MQLPTAYNRQMWDFSRVNNNSIKRSLLGINWEKSLTTLGAETFASRNFRERKNSRNFCISRA